MLIQNILIFLHFFRAFSVAPHEFHLSDTDFEFVFGPLVSGFTAM
jgi:hypothetical protein